MAFPGLGRATCRAQWMQQRLRSLCGGWWTAFCGVGLCLLLMSAAHRARAQMEGTPVTQLAGKAQALELRGKLDLARESWVQVLQLDAANAQALAAMVHLSRVAGRSGEERVYAERLRSLQTDGQVSSTGPGSAPESRQPELGQGRPHGGGLQEAERLVARGQTVAAMTMFHELYGTHPPPGDIAVVYYRAEGATEAGRSEAIAGLRALADQFPRDKRYQLALGQLLLGRERTAAEGRQLLEGIPHGVGLRSPLRASLADGRSAEGTGRALPRTGASPIAAGGQPSPAHKAELSPTPLALSASVTSRPETQKPEPAAPQLPIVLTTVSTVATATSTGVDTPREIATAEAAAHAGRAGEAEARFKVALAREPDNAAALAGMGRLRREQRKYDEAVLYLERAALAGPYDAKLAGELRGARHELGGGEPGSLSLNDQPVPTVAAGTGGAAQMAVTRDVMSASGTANAELFGGRAANRGALPATDLRSAVEQARSALREGRPAEAYTEFRAILARDFDLPEAWSGLLAALHGSGHDREALAQMGNLPAATRSRMESDPLFLEAAGSIYASLGQEKLALQFWGQLEQQFSTDHKRAPAELEIAVARLLATTGEDTQLYNALMSLGGRSDLKDEQRWAVQEIWAKWATGRAVTQAHAGQTVQAASTLKAAADTFAGSPAVIRPVAAGYREIGLPKEGVVLLRSQDLSQAPAEDVRSAVVTALAARDLEQAEVWLRLGLTRFAADPAMLSLAARYEGERGHKKEAAVYQQAALARTPKPDAATRLTDTLLQSRETSSGDGEVESRRAPFVLSAAASLPAGNRGDGKGEGTESAGSRPYLPSYDPAFLPVNEFLPLQAPLQSPR